MRRRMLGGKIHPAHHASAGDLVIIACFVELDDVVARTWCPRVVFVDELNREVESRQERLPADSLGA